MKVNSAWARRLLLSAAALAFGCSSAAAKSAAVDSGAPDAGGGDGGAPAVDSGSDGACAPSTADAGITTYTADDPNIVYSGRVDFTDVTHPKFAASAVYVSAKFRGSSVQVSFQDENRYSDYNLYDVYVDGMAPVKIVPAAGVTTYDATPPGLCPGEHTVTFVKRTEADVGTTTFVSFGFDGNILPSTPLTRHIEIIGDSITCGVGVEATSPTAPECTENGLVNRIGMAETGYGQGVENGYLAFGPLLARQLDAEWHVTCAGGIGLVRNYYSRSDPRTMPMVYPYLYPEDTTNLTLWDPSNTQWKPDAIVIALGTNDFSRDSGDTNNPRDPMPITSTDGGVGLVQGYIQFIDQLAAYYPGVRVVLVSSPILGNMYPTPSDMELSDHQAAIADVVAYYSGDGGASADAGAPNVQVFAAIIDKITGTGCGGHPGIRQQADAAGQIAPIVKTAMGW